MRREYVVNQLIGVHIEVFASRKLCLYFSSVRALGCLI